MYNVAKLKISGRLSTVYSIIVKVHSPYPNPKSI